jgi:hypothetical protein
VNWILKATRQLNKKACLLPRSISTNYTRSCSAFFAAVQTGETARFRSYLFDVSRFLSTVSQGTVILSALRKFGSFHLDLDWTDMCFRSGLSTSFPEHVMLRRFRTSVHTSTIIKLSTEKSSTVAKLKRRSSPAFPQNFQRSRPAKPARWMYFFLPPPFRPTKADRQRLMPKSSRLSVGCCWAGCQKGAPTSLNKNLHRNKPSQAARSCLSRTGSYLLLHRALST